MCFQYIIAILFGLIYSVQLREITVNVNPKLEARIIGGSEVADFAEIPFQVSIQHYGDHICGGSFISERWVLTAAHCTIGRNIHALSVRAGSLQHAQGGIILGIMYIKQHLRYDSRTLDYNFSLLRLMSWNTNNIIFEPARLPKQGEDVPDKTWLRVSGWGADEYYDVLSATLQAANVSKVNQEECNKSYAFRGGITNRMICAGLVDGGVDACYGDGGGPLTWNGVLVGIVSWGYGCALKNYPTVYSRVSSVRDWICCETGL